MTTPEDWRPIPGYPCYWASDSGRIASTKQGGWRVLRPRVNNKGYSELSVHNGTGFVTMRVHTLVALAFYGARPSCLVTRHLDGNKLNNRVDNLRYGTNLENEEDSRLHGVKGPGKVNVGANNGRAKLTWEAVDEIRRRLKTQRNRDVCIAMGVSSTTVARIAANTHWKLEYQPLDLKVSE